MASDKIQQMKAKSNEILERLSPGQKVTLTVLSVLIAFSLAGIMYVASKTDYALLYSGEDQRVGGQIIQALKDRKIDYDMSGNSIRVPAHQVAELRMSLVTDGIMNGGGVGYELVDKSDMFGVPDDIIQLNKKRILEGELSRSVSTVEGVRQARVILAMPKASLFVEDQKPVTASVMLELSGKRNLGKNQVRGIVEIVAGAVPGLDPERVNVVDNSGRVLNRYAEDLIGGQTSLEYQQNKESELRLKAQSMIERIVGPGNVEVVVSTKMDFSRGERTEEIFNPEKQVARSEETLTEERENGGNRVGGGAGDNVAQGVVRVGDASSSSRERVATNYEIDKTTMHVRDIVPRLQKISVAVVINTLYKKSGEDDEEIDETLSPEDKKQFTELVQSAIGFSASRNDVVTVQGRPFVRASVDIISQLEEAESNRKWETIGRWGVILLFTGFILFIMINLYRFLTAGVGDAEILQDGQLPPGEDQLALPGAELLDELDEDEGPLLEKIREYVKRNPDKASAVIRYWLSPADEE